MQPCRSEFLQIRDARHHVRIWGEARAPTVFLLHGWMDVSASFQFIVDELRQDWCVVAPDWRGFGLSAWQGRPYWFPDYYADLDALLEHYAPGAPARLVGHSMGGNVASIYAGLRPERVAALASLEGFGIGDSRPESAPGRLSDWLDQQRNPPARHSYATRDELARRLRRHNPRLSAERAAFLAIHLGIADAQGGIVVAGDSSHRQVNPVLYRLEEAMACWKRVTAPVLWLAGEDSAILARHLGHPEDFRRRRECFARLHEQRIPDCGHNLHHDQPMAVAAALERFLPR